MLSLGRFITGALITALIAIGGVWFVVDVSLRGMEKSVDVTNERITDLQTNISELRSEMREEFEKTRTAIERASFELFERDSINNSFEIRIAVDNEFDVDEFYEAVHRQEFEIVKVENSSVVDVAYFLVKELAFASSLGSTGSSDTNSAETLTVRLDGLPQSSANYNAIFPMRDVIETGQFKITNLTVYGKILRKAKNDEGFNLTYSSLKKLSNQGHAFIKFKTKNDVTLLPVKVAQVAN